MRHLFLFLLLAGLVFAAAACGGLNTGEADFDDMPERAVARTAPLVTRWVFREYRRVRGGGRFVIMVPAGSNGSR